MNFKNTHEAMGYGRQMTAKEAAEMATLYAHMEISRKNIMSSIDEIDREVEGAKELINNLLLLITKMQFVREAIESWKEEKGKIPCEN
jgi:hypothetical protein